MKKTEVGKIKVKNNIPQILVYVTSEGEEVFKNLYDHWSEKLHIQCPHCDKVFHLQSALKSQTGKLDEQT